MQLHRYLVGLLFAGLSLPGYTADITVTGWSTSLPDSVMDAGMYYPSTLESELPTTATVSISGLMNSTDTWKVMASTNITGININVQCSENRSSITNENTVSGCNNYTSLTSSEQEIFSGTGNPAGIPLKFKITNFDVTDGTGTKNIEIQYRVVTP